MNLSYTEEQVMLREQIQKFCETEYDFYKREDTFSIGICNGCKLMSLLEWIPKGITLEENISRIVCLVIIN